MDRLAEWTPDLPPIDLLALALLGVGVVLGLLRGMGPMFGMFLWLVVALWLGTVVGPVLLEWMPNTSGEEAEHAAYVLISVVVLGLPILARLLGGSGGKKKSDPAVQYKLFGMLIAAAGVALLFTMVAPHARRVDALANRFGEARSSAAAAEIADWVRWLYPDAHRAALRAAIEASGASEEEGTAATPR